MIGGDAIGRLAVGQEPAVAVTVVALVSSITARASLRVSNRTTTALRGRLSTGSRLRVHGGAALPGLISTRSSIRINGGVNLPARLTTAAKSRSQTTSKTGLQGLSFVSTGGLVNHTCIVVRYVVIPAGVAGVSTVLTAANVTAPTSLTASIAALPTILKPNTGC